MVRIGKIIRKPTIYFCVMIVLYLLLSGIALAAGGGHDGGEDNAALIDLWKRLLNFALLVIILGWAIKKTGITGFFKKRTEEIGQKLGELEREKEEAESKCREAEKQLKEFEVKREEILEQFKSEGLAEKERIVAEAQNRVQAIIKQAEFTIQQEMESARERLKQEAVSVAAQKAQEILAKEITDTDQDHLVNDFIERVGKIH